MLYTMYTLTNQCRYEEMSSHLISAANSAAAPKTSLTAALTHKQTNTILPASCITMHSVDKENHTVHCTTQAPYPHRMASNAMDDAAQAGKHSTQHSCVILMAFFSAVPATRPGWQKSPSTHIDAPELPSNCAVTRIVPSAVQPAASWL